MHKHQAIYNEVKELNECGGIASHEAIHDAMSSLGYDEYVTDEAIKSLVDLGVIEHDGYQYKYNLLVAWMTQHPPEDGMADDLERIMGHRVCVVMPERLIWTSGQDMWNNAISIAWVMPTVIVAVTPLTFAGDFLSIANNEGIPVVRPLMSVLGIDNGKRLYGWTGGWSRTVRVIIETEAWGT